MRLRDTAPVDGREAEKKGKASNARAGRREKRDGETIKQRRAGKNKEDSKDTEEDKIRRQIK